jgi:hypothetical protein
MTKRSESETIARKKYLLFWNKAKWYNTNYCNKVTSILLLSKYWSYKKINSLRLKYTFSELFEWREKYVINKS